MQEGVVGRWLLAGLVLLLALLGSTPALGQDADYVPEVDLARWVDHRVSGHLDPDREVPQSFGLFVLPEVRVLSGRLGLNARPVPTFYASGGSDTVVVGNQTRTTTRSLTHVDADAIPTAASLNPVVSPGLSLGLQTESGNEWGLQYRYFLAEGDVAELTLHEIRAGWKPLWTLGCVRVGGLLGTRIQMGRLEVDRALVPVGLYSSTSIETRNPTSFSTYSHESSNTMTYLDSSYVTDVWIGGPEVGGEARWHLDGLGLTLFTRLSTAQTVGYSRTRTKIAHPLLPGVRNVSDNGVLWLTVAEAEVGVGWRLPYWPCAELRGGYTVESMWANDRSGGRPNQPVWLHGAYVGLNCTF